MWVDVEAGDGLEHLGVQRCPRLLALRGWRKDRLVLRAVDTGGRTAPRVRCAGQRQEQQNAATALSGYGRGRLDAACGR